MTLVAGRKESSRSAINALFVKRSRLMQRLPRSAIDARPYYRDGRFICGHLVFVLGTGAGSGVRN